MRYLSPDTHPAVVHTHRGTHARDVRRPPQLTHGYDPLPDFLAASRWCGAQPAVKQSALLHSTAARWGATEDHMAALGIELPAYQDAVWSYVKAQRDGDKLYIGDHVGQRMP